jgi:hypothetical protein
MTWSALFGSTFVILLVVGCSRNYKVGELAGRYAIDIGTGTDQLELMPNGNYIHTYRTKAGVAAKQIGLWALENIDNRPHVVLNGFRPLLGESIKGSGIYLLPISRSFGKIYLITNVDLNEGYTRLD